MRIQHKLFLALFATCLLLMAAVVLLMQWSVTSGMVDYVNQRQRERAQEVVQDLTEFYRQYDGWGALMDNPWLFQRLAYGGRHEGGPEGPRHTRELPPHLRMTLVDRDGHWLAGGPPRGPRLRLAINVDGATVGWLISGQLREIHSGFEERFLQRQRMTLLAIGAVMAAAFALLALPLARHLITPIRQLAAGTHQLTQGRYEVSLPVQRRDELGELARDFNELAHTLAANDNSRKRWLADISHELRTPLAILRGELEAMLDGVRPLTAENLESIRQEVQHLNRLVDDLHALTAADIGGLQYRKADCDVAELWREQCEAHQSWFEDAGLALAVAIPPAPAMVYGDESRLRQLLDNLLENSRKYTQSGGRVLVALHARGDTIELTVDDTAPGVPTEALPKLFDHLFRVDDSRSRQTGGSGLGLAICQRIVAAHQGSIAAEPSPQGGLRVRVVLPVAAV